MRRAPPPSLPQLTKHLSAAHVEIANAVFKKHFDRVADLLEARMGATTGPSRDTAPSPARRDQGAAKRPRVQQTLEDDMEGGDDGDADDDEEEEGTGASISRAVELERFSKVKRGGSRARGVGLTRDYARRLARPTSRRGRRRTGASVFFVSTRRTSASFPSISSSLLFFSLASTRRRTSNGSLATRAA